MIQSLPDVLLTGTTKTNSTIAFCGLIIEQAFGISLATSRESGRDD